jgi:site-specific DNA-methyltransferase (adenine-specific)
MPNMSEVTSHREVEQLREPITHTIYESSSEEMDELEDESVHLVATSPPYWDIKDYGTDAQIGYNDSLQEYINRLREVWMECERVLHPGCRMVINSGDQYHSGTDGKPYHITPLNAKIVNSVIESTDMIFLGNIIWQKISNTETSGGASVMGSYGRPRNGYVSYDYEYISIFKKPGKDPAVPEEIKEENAIDKEEWKRLFSGHWNFTGKRQEKHPAPFPEELPRRLLRMFTFSGDTVLDPFVGSGTTTKVADDMNRSSVGYEIGFETPNDQDWREVIREKIGYYDYSESERDQRFSLP